MADEAVKKQMKAKVNQVFLSTCCSKAFMDRDAKIPVEIDMVDAVVQRGTTVPHPKYPDDPDLATEKWVDVPGVHVLIAESEANPCCKTHTVLCNSIRLRFREEADGRQHIVGAEQLE